MGHLKQVYTNLSDPIEIGGHYYIHTIILRSSTGKLFPKEEIFMENDIGEWSFGGLRNKKVNLIYDEAGHDGVIRNGNGLKFTSLPNSVINEMTIYYSGNIPNHAS